MNDTRFDRLKAIRDEFDIYLDTGDAIKTGNLGIPLREEPVWARFAELGCTAGAPGNRESHVLKSAFEAKLAGRRHALLCANLRDRQGGQPLPASKIVEVNGLRIGLVGVMVPMVTEKMKSKAVSHYLWTQPIPAAIEEGEKLRSEVDLLFALTHIGHRQDTVLAEKTGIYDAIFGGHSHTVLQRPELINRTWICQGGSHGRFYGDYVWEDGRLTGGLHPLG